MHWYRSHSIKVPKKWNKKVWWDLWTNYNKQDNTRLCRKCDTHIKNEHYGIHLRKHNYFGCDSVKEYKRRRYQQTLMSRFRTDIIYWNLSSRETVIYCNEHYNLWRNSFEYSYIVNGVEKQYLWNFDFFVVPLSEVDIYKNVIKSSKS